MIPLEDVERLFAICRRLLHERRRADKISGRILISSDPSATRKANVDLNWLAMDIARIEAELHAAAVDAGLADLREASHYAERIAKPTGWHTYPWTPAQPRSLTHDKTPPTDGRTAI
jgi:hypothetical protein